MVVTPREAATVMLVRDQPDLHVFMQRRSLEADFVGGAYVFPGGSLDPADRDPLLFSRCYGCDDTGASRLLGAPSGGLGFWVAAIRESFEEAGVLLARSAITGAPLDLDEPGVAARLDAARGALCAGERSFVDVVTGENLLLDAGALHLFSHWITPAAMPRRYDTWFFVAEAPSGHAYVHDDGEAVASTWIRPADAVERGKRGEFEIIFPTLRNLQALSRFETADALVDAVRSATDVSTTQPRIVADGNGVRILLPGDPGFYDASESPDGELPLDALKTLEHRGGVATGAPRDTGKEMA